MTLIKNYGIHWFRRDLRVAGNSALQRNWRINKGYTLGIFCFDKKFLARSDFSINRFQFFIETLLELKKELRLIGSDLLVLDIGPLEAFSFLFEKLKKNNLSLPNTITWNRDYEPFAIKRDSTMESFFKKQNIVIHTERDHLIIEPNELFKDSDHLGYSVYTPFARKWLKLFKTDEVQERISTQKSGLTYLKNYKKGNLKKMFKLTWEKLCQKKIIFPDTLKNYRSQNIKSVTINIPTAGSLAAFDKLQNFKAILKEYSFKRDFPFEEGTSGFSIFLKNGSLTNAQIISFLDLKPYEKRSSSGQAVFFSELIWREFYYHVIYRNPLVEKQAFNKKYLNLKWRNNKKWFQAWKEGKTGFPIVDAGMRQLIATGVMHNRLRMIVASFLIKDLLIDWRWGEKYFMEQLLDGDLAPNNGGWQWAASTGCDAQPYFRIFNPWTQGKKFDLKGQYIKKYIPELKDLDSKSLHQPILNHKEYPAPIVDHSIQREKTLNFYGVNKT